MNKMQINEYRLDDFGHSEKAIWLVGRWSYPRLETRYTNFFIPISQVALKHNRVFIPQWLVDSINKEHRLTQYKYSFPTVLKTYNVSESKWDEFKRLYKYNYTKPLGI